jgi:hypothetical protein
MFTARLLGLAVFLCPFATVVAQTGGTLTGTVADSSGALIPGVQIILTNPATGTKFETVTTGTGNYTLPTVPVGRYTLTADHAGFSKFSESNVQVDLATTTRVNIAMQVGTATQSVEVVAESTLLKTENAEQETTLSDKQIAELPINFGIGAGAIRNPYSFVQMTPGATFSGWQSISINGGNANFKIMLEGQEMDSAYQNEVSDEQQPSVEAIEQFTLQTSNFSAEYGSVGGGGLYNFTVKSGTNKYHGSVYEYFENTFMNAGIPFTNNGTGLHTKVVKHLDDYGFTLGGPVRIPKVYNGKNKTFFFFSLEYYRDREQLYNGITTVPNAAYLAGNLSNNLLVTSPPDRNLGTDFAGRAIIQNAIYDPASAVLNSAGERVLNVFPNNTIPQARFDPVAVKIMSYFPAADVGPAGAYVNNFAESGAFYKLQYLPSVKIDQNIGEKIKLSGYLEYLDTDKSNGVDGLPPALSQVRDQLIRTKTGRINYDQTLSPRLLFHFGVGYIHHRNPDTVPIASAGFDSTTLGIQGAAGTGFPRISGIGDSVLGGMVPSMGPGTRLHSIDSKPVANGSLAWVNGNHTIKGGFTWKIDQEVLDNFVNLSPSYSFSSAETAQPLYGQVLPSGTGIGSAWASFLLGQFDSVSMGNFSAPLYRRAAWGLFLQDTWKITRKFTLDYGLRWDVQAPLNELHSREASFSPTVVNENANGLLGGVIYEGSGPGRCDCALVKTYPYAFAPRLGLAYQLDAKTVLRGGWGFSYGKLAPTSSQPSTVSMGFNSLSQPSIGNGVAEGSLSQPLTSFPTFSTASLNAAAYDPGALVTPGAAVTSAPAFMDPNGARPPRVDQWNISLQREIAKDIVIEASYIGNHGVWLNAGGGGDESHGVGSLVSYDAVSPAVLAAHGLGDLTNATTRTLLSSTITSAAAIAAGFSKPYANFPSSGTVLQSLRPFPQYSSIAALWEPLGASWYDALQMKLTKRFSHGLVAGVSYAYSMAEDNATNAGSIYNRASFKGLSANDTPNILNVNVDYTIPAFGFVQSSRIARTILADWRLGTIQTYSSGALLSTPTSSNSIGSYVSTGYTRMVRVPGVPLYQVEDAVSGSSTVISRNLNCGCIDPTVDTVLNPAAWVNQAAGVPGSNIVYYNDFRAQRRPVISASLGKLFRIKEHMTLSLRAEFFNLFNTDLSIAAPSTGSPQNPPTLSNGVLTGGFGYLNYTGITANSVSSSVPTPRTGQLVARIDF